MDKINKEDIRIIYALLAKMGRAGDATFKADLVAQFSDGRETSTKELTPLEGYYLILALRKMRPLTPQEQKVNEKRRLVLYYAHMMHWEEPCGCGVELCGCQKKVDMERVNKFCVDRGYLHKPLNDYSLIELSTLIFQFEEVYKSLLKKV